jgi:hypothetical protein
MSEPSEDSYETLEEGGMSYEEFLARPIPPDPSADAALQAVRYFEEWLPIGKAALGSATEHSLANLIAFVEQRAPLETRYPHGVEVTGKDLTTGEKASQVLMNTYLLITVGDHVMVNEQKNPKTGEITLTVRGPVTG